MMIFIKVLSDPIHGLIEVIKYNKVYQAGFVVGEHTTIINTLCNLLLVVLLSSKSSQHCNWNKGLAL